MREARIIFPAEGKDTFHNVMGAIDAITSVFGGATVSDGVGHWRDRAGSHVREVIHIVDIAYEASEENDRKLYDIAWKFQHDAKQAEVYLRYSNGHVQMVTTTSCMDNGEFDLIRSIGHDIDEDGTMTNVGVPDDKC